jgi:hypothetical protein
VTPPSGQTKIPSMGPAPVTAASGGERLDTFGAATRRQRSQPDAMERP